MEMWNKLKGVVTEQMTSASGAVHPVICKTCRHENPANNNFCEGCGVKLEDITERESESVCSNCDKLSPVGDDFCVHCGSKMTAVCTDDFDESFAETVYCEACGESTDGTQLFCTHCGTPFLDKTSVEPAAVPVNIYDAPYHTEIQQEEISIDIKPRFSISLSTEDKETVYVDDEERKKKLVKYMQIPREL